jgi:GT2 family glycosyltransferase
MFLDFAVGRAGDWIVFVGEARMISNCKFDIEERPLRVSVVMPTYRRPALLERCLQALVHQDFAARDYEVIVADDAASEMTRGQVERWAEHSRPHVRYVPVTRANGPAAARNVGWRAARGEIIAFTDDDTIPARNWLKAGAQVFVDGVAGAWGRILMPLPAEPTDYERDAAGLAEAGFVTANCFCRRSALEAVGGFDERFEAAWREDSDLCFSLLERGMKLAHAPEAVVAHPIRPAPWGVSLRQQRKTMFDALLYRKHPRLYRSRIPAFPADYYATVGALALALGAGLNGGKGVAAGAALAWAALTGRFCARRLRGNSRAPSHMAEMVLTSALIPPLSLYWRWRGALKYRVFFV